ncbi:MAG TPA: hypothetical protein VNL69_09030 [Bacteroidota bacterium]|nr:hypothetical protein [Bacteroidota bacterium]
MRKLLGVLGLGATWGVLWGVFFLALVSIIGLFRPQDIQPGEGPLVALTTGMLVGFVSGVLFAFLLTIIEGGKLLDELAFHRVALWGLLASGVWPLLTEADDRMIYILCPLGAMLAVAFLATARSVGLNSPLHRGSRRIHSRVLARLLQDTCS